jgi:hypothetical protein
MHGPYTGSVDNFHGEQGSVHNFYNLTGGSIAGMRALKLWTDPIR